MCNGPRNNQCKYFKWADEVNNNKSSEQLCSSAKNIEPKHQKMALCLSDPDSIGTFVKGQGIALYCECSFLRKVPDSYQTFTKQFPVSLTLWVSSFIIWNFISKTLLVYVSVKICNFFSSLNKTVLFFFAKMALLFLS